MPATPKKPLDPNTLLRAQELLDEFNQRDRQWRTVFHKLNLSKPYARSGSFLPEEDTAAQKSYEQEYRSDLSSMAAAKRARNNARDFKAMFSKADAGLDQAIPLDKSGHDNKLPDLYLKKARFDQDKAALIARIETDVAPVTQNKKSGLLNTVVKLLEAGKYEKALEKIDAAEPGRLGKLILSRTDSSLISADLATLRRRVEAYWDLDDKANVVETRLAAVEKYTADKIKSAMRYSLFADKLFKPGVNANIDYNAARHAGIALLQKYQRSWTGLSQSEIIQDLRAAKGAINLTKLSRAMETLEGVESDQYVAAKSRYEKSAAKFEQCREFAESCRKVGKTEIAMPGRMTFKTVGAVLSEAVARADVDEIGEDEMAGLITQAENRQASWREDSILVTVQNSAKIFANTAAYNASASIAAPDPGVATRAFNLAVRLKENVRSIAVQWSPV